jgi:hypothetical protein
MNNRYPIEVYHSYNYSIIKLGKCLNNQKALINTNNIDKRAKNATYSINLPLNNFQQQIVPRHLKHFKKIILSFG